MYQSGDPSNAPRRSTRAPSPRCAGFVERSNTSSLTAEVSHASCDAPRVRAVRRVGGVAGVAGFVLAIAGLSALGDMPDPHNATAPLAAYFVKHRNSMFTSTTFVALAGTWRGPREAVEEPPALDLNAPEPTA